MPIPTNDWYTIQSGDTLSKIAKEAGIPDWKTIYNNSKNDQFRKDHPDPNKIYPGDKIWIPGAPKTSTGKKTVFVAPAEKIQVTEIYFESQVDVHYVRLAASHSDYIAPGVPAKPGYLHKDPPTIYPEAGKAHWVYDTTSSKVTESWPTVLIREGATTSGLAKRSIKVSFSAATAFDGDRIIKAESASGELVVEEKTVTFKKGIAEKVALSFTKVPDTVEKLGGLVIKWSAKKGAADTFVEIGSTKHTFFIIDERPVKANLMVNNAHQDKYLFEIIDWSCSWAKGTSGNKGVVAAIWSKFYPAKNPHATKLVYWKTEDWTILPQDIISAILSQDDTSIPERQNAASCIVFDRIFINCIGLHGIKAAEIRITTTHDSFLGIMRGGKTYECTQFNATSIKAQGNFKAPSFWASHWIANLSFDTMNWEIYDPSYGAAPFNSDSPYINNLIDVSNYEKGAVKDFRCTDIATSAIVNLPAGATITDPPHIQGEVLWKP